MIEAVAWVAGGVFALCVLMVCFTAWLRLLDDDAKIRRDLKHRCHHKWQG